jgi:hypothetical protein
MGWVYEYLKDRLEEEIRKRLKGEEANADIKFDSETLSRVEYGEGEPEEGIFKGEAVINGKRYEISYEIRAFLNRGQLDDPYVDYTVKRVSIRKK